MLVLEHSCALRICRVISKIWGSCACAYDVIMHIPMTSFIDANVNNVTLGHIFSIL